MKPFIVNTCLFIAVITALYFFTIKFRQPDNIDKVKIGLTGIDRYISNNSRLGYICSVNDGALPNIANYILTPVNLDMLNVSALDTTLIIVPLDQKVLDMIGQENILWQNKDDRLKYILISKH